MAGQRGRLPGEFLVGVILLSFDYALYHCTMKEMHRLHMSSNQSDSLTPSVTSASAAAGRLSKLLNLVRVTSSSNNNNNQVSREETTRWRTSVAFRIIHMTRI